MTALSRAVAALKPLEDCRLLAYWDKKGECWTIGYGETGPHIVEGLVWTQDEADAAMAARLSTLKVVILAEAVKVKAPPMSDPELAAFLLAAYNLGCHAFLESEIWSEWLMTLADVERRRIDTAKAFTHYYHAHDGEAVPGLLRRRMIEAALFLEG